MFESKEEKKAYNEGYKNGREWYKNDIKKEISEINTAIRVIEKFYGDHEILNSLEDIKSTLECLQIKVNNEFDKIKDM